MRNYLLLLSLAALALPAQAQTERGSKLVGLSVGNLNYTDYDDSGTLRGTNRRTFSARVTPGVAWFVVDRLAVGGALDLSFSRATLEYQGVDGPVTSITRSWGYGLAPSVRYYFVDASKHKLFARLGANVTRFSDQDRYLENGRNRNRNRYGHTETGWNVGVGYNYFVSSNVALEATVGYQRRSVYYFSAPNPNVLAVELGFSVFLLPGQSVKGN